MKVSIKGQPRKEESVMELYLAETDGGVGIFGTDANGVSWCVAVISEKGICLVSSVSDSTGWPIKNGALKQGKTQ